MIDVDDPSKEALLHLLYQVMNAPLRKWPYPHFLLEKVFPDDYYAQLVKALPGDDHFEKIESVYDNANRYQEDAKIKGQHARFVVPMTKTGLQKVGTDRREAWRQASEIVKSKDLGEALLSRFATFTFGQMAEDEVLSPELLLIRDRGGYEIGPHTDHPQRALVWIMYLADPDAAPQEHLGTGIYVPKDVSFRCKGGPHYPHDNFFRAFQAPYRPNTALCFLKTDNSFHGVEPVAGGEERTILHFYLRRPTVADGNRATPAHVGTPETALAT